MYRLALLVCICISYCICSKGKKDLLSQLLPLAPKLAWIHSRSAGVDHSLFPALIEADNVSLTNAR